MQRHSLRIGGHGQQDLGPVGTMVSAVTIAADSHRTLAFKIHTAQIIEHQGNPLGEALLIELLLQPHPLSAQFIHRLIEIVLVEIFLGLIQSAGGGQEGTAGVIGQSQLGAGKEDAAKHHGLEQAGVTGRIHEAKEPRQTQGVPGLAEHGQAAETPRLGQFQAIGGDKVLAAQGLGNELTGVRWQAGDVANSAGAGALGGAEGFADQVSQIRGLAVFAFGGLDEHTCYIIVVDIRHSKQKVNILLATIGAELLIFGPFHHMRGEVNTTATF